MELCSRLAVPMRRIWIRVATRLGFKKTGLKRLRHEVSTCEYEDVRVLWDMLHKADAEIAKPSPETKGEKKKKKKKKNVCSSFFEWACRRI